MITRQHNQKTRRSTTSLFISLCLSVYPSSLLCLSLPSPSLSFGMPVCLSISLSLSLSVCVSFSFFLSPPPLCYLVWPECIDQLFGDERRGGKYEDKTRRNKTTQNKANARHDRHDRHKTRPTQSKTRSTPDKTNTRPHDQIQDRTISRKDETKDHHKKTWWILVKRRRKSSSFSLYGESRIFPGQGKTRRGMTGLDKTRQNEARQSQAKKTRHDKKHKTKTMTLPKFWRTSPNQFNLEGGLGLD